MSYRRVRPQAIHINSINNAFLRQQWAKKFLTKQIQDKVVINIDETWIGQTDFKRRKWGKRGSNNSYPVKNLQPRLSLILALDSTGTIYYSITQYNTDSYMMEIFFEQLTIRLDQDRPGWRKNSVVLIDNAPYHSSNQSMRMFQQLKIPLMFLAPYSFDVAPCELFFAWFKRVDINPDGIAVGKK